MIGRGVKDKKAVMMKRLNPDNISESLELALQTEGIIYAASLVPDKKIFYITRLLDGKT